MHRDAHDGLVRVDAPQRHLHGLAPAQAVHREILAEAPPRAHTDRRGRQPERHVTLLLECLIDGLRHGLRRRHAADELTVQLRDLRRLGHVLQVARVTERRECGVPEIEHRLRHSGLRDRDVLDLRPFFDEANGAPVSSFDERLGATAKHLALHDHGGGRTHQRRNPRKPQPAGGVDRHAIAEPGPAGDAKGDAGLGSFAEHFDVRRHALFGGLPSGPTARTARAAGE